MHRLQDREIHLNVPSELFQNFLESEAEACTTSARLLVVCCVVMGLILSCAGVFKFYKDLVRMEDLRRLALPSAKVGSICSGLLHQESSFLLVRKYSSCKAEAIVALGALLLLYYACWQTIFWRHHGVASWWARHVTHPLEGWLTFTCLCCFLPLCRLVPKGSHLSSPSLLPIFGDSSS